LGAPRHRAAMLLRAAGVPAAAGPPRALRSLRLATWRPRGLPGGAQRRNERHCGIWLAGALTLTALFAHLPGSGCQIFRSVPFVQHVDIHCLCDNSGIPSVPGMRPWEQSCLCHVSRTHVELADAFYCSHRAARTYASTV